MTAVLIKALCTSCIYRKITDSPLVDSVRYNITIFHFCSLKAAHPGDMSATLYLSFLVEEK